MSDKELHETNYTCASPMYMYGRKKPVTLSKTQLLCSAWPLSLDDNQAMEHWWPKGL